jgi:hypothetical protein
VKFTPLVTAAAAFRDLCFFASCPSGFLLSRTGESAPGQQRYEGFREARGRRLSTPCGRACSRGRTRLPRRARTLCKTVVWCRSSRPCRSIDRGRRYSAAHRHRRQQTDTTGRLLDSALIACRATGARLVFPGNVSSPTRHPTRTLPASRGQTRRLVQHSSHRVPASVMRCFATASASPQSVTNKDCPQVWQATLVLWRGQCWVSNFNRSYRTLPGWDSRSRRSQ